MPLLRAAPRQCQRKEPSYRRVTPSLGAGQLRRPQSGPNTFGTRMARILADAPDPFLYRSEESAHIRKIRDQECWGRNCAFLVVRHVTLSLLA